ncbi:MAG: hypothetical protein JNM43_05245 [Planctomycetaceae bacterium]|nr:hypothetical protein [Planctomycetaceae bacterium]
MSQRLLSIAALFFLLTCGPSALAQTDELISGPQPGEGLPPLVVREFQRDGSGQEKDLTALNGDKSFVIVFFHERTRPAFGLSNAILRFAETRKDLAANLVFLTADSTETENWLKQVRGMMPGKIMVGVSPDGLEGPGAWGLNRNVALTIVIGQKGKVVQSFALRQPAIDSDGPKILQAIADVSGGGEIPKIADLAGGANMRRGQEAKDGSASEEVLTKLRSLLRPVIQKDASEADVRTAAEAVEKESAANEAFRKELTASCRRIVNSGKLENYGSAVAQEYLRTWAKTDSDKEPAKDDQK